MATSEDAGFKYILGRYPDEALAVFCPELLAQRGSPDEAALLPTEVPILTHDGSHRLMDLAIRFAWRGQDPVIITLIEHWSARHRIDLPRVLRYAAELVIRHRGATVLPIILLTDAKPLARPPVLVHGLASWQAIRLEPRCIDARRPAAVPPGLLGNHVAVLLTALVRGCDPAQVVRQVVADYLALAHAIEDLRVLLPFILSLASITTDAEVTATYRLLREDHAMLNIIDLIKAEGKAEGKAEATLAILRRRIACSTLTIDAARSEVADLRRDGDLTTAEAELILARLG